jgi:pilus assembly protein CpaF
MSSSVFTAAQLGVTRAVPLVDLSRRAHALLAERFPHSRVKHKPLSILRQEGRRALEQFFDAQTPPPPRPERDKLIEEVLGEATGFGPLEELFREEAVREVMVMAAAQVIARRDGGWVPTSVRFRDPAHYRGYLRRLADTGEQLVVNGAAGDGAFDVRLSNGFRVVGVLPPEVLDQPPLAVFVRGQGAMAVAATPAPQGGSGVVPVTLTRVAALTNGSGIMRRPDVPAPPFSKPLPVPPAPVSEFYAPADPDPKERLRRRVLARITRACATAGVYDLSSIPPAELQKIVLAHIDELNAEERNKLTPQEVQVLALEILAGMRR